MTVLSYAAIARHVQSVSGARIFVNKLVAPGKGLLKTFSTDEEAQKTDTIFVGSAIRHTWHAWL
jgi:hypothetical protein